MDPMFLLFAHEDYYPQGGADDLVGEYESEAEARSHLAGAVREEDMESSPGLGAHLYSLAEKRIVARWEGEATYAPFRVQWVEL